MDYNEVGADILSIYQRIKIKPIIIIKIECLKSEKFREAINQDKNYSEQ